ncbi:MAG: hypothetical protein NBV63_01485 [Candidatus Pacebacteria bacterium]|nr:hypothetical protein [Candidatus Paceibacterota bacterium]
MRGEPLSREVLVRLYIEQQLSAAEIGARLKCSTNKVHYWLARRGICIRSRSDALYARHNPNGDPFRFTQPKTLESAFLYGLGIGLYWGEGNRKNRTAVRLGNTDPKLIQTFLRFLIEVCGLEKRKIRFGLQVFSDMNPVAVLTFWSKTLGYPKAHFGKVVVTPQRGVGTYREKTKHGVLTVYVSNKKLRDLLVGQIETL